MSYDKNKFKLGDATDAKQNVVNRIADGWFDHNSVTVDTTNSITLGVDDFIVQMTTADTAATVTVPYDTAATGDSNEFSGKAFIIDATDTSSTVNINVSSAALTTISGSGSELIVNDGSGSGDTSSFGWTNITLR